MSFKSAVKGQGRGHTHYIGKSVREGGDCDEVICTGWGEPGGEWTEWGWRNKKGSWCQV